MPESGSAGRRMSRFFVAVFAVFLAVVVIGFVMLGAFPPHARRQPVEHVLSNDKFH